MSLRITSGQFGGRVVKSVPSLRPMMDKVRKALFDILGDKVSSASVADLFAGSGAIGIEALSRGASRAIFVDKDRVHYNLIKENLANLGISDLAAVRLMTVEDFIAANEYPYDLVVAAPWYDELPDITGWEKLLAEGGILVLEHRSSNEPPANDNLRILDHKKYGDTALTFYTGV